MMVSKKLISNLLFLTALILFLPYISHSQNQPKSLGKGYSEGGSIFEVPVFSPKKLEIDINSKYERKYAYPQVSVKHKPGTKIVTPSIKKQKVERLVLTDGKLKPKSLKQDYSEGFVIKRKIEPEVGFISPAEKKALEKKTQKPNPAKVITPPKSIAPAVIKKEEIMSVTSRVIPFKPRAVKTAPPPPPVKTKRKAIVVIDPGHGGKDPGAIGRLGTKEKQITFLYSVALKKELERTGRYKVILTRYADKYVPLHSRVKKARRFNGDIMISIHADSIANPDVRGFSVYTISDKRVKREANKLLRKSDSEEVIRGVKMRGESKDVKEALIDFAQKETKSVSDSFSTIVAKHLGQKVKPLKRTNREGSFAVLTGADIPSVLIELGYLSNIYEERLLRKKDHKKKIVKSIKTAIDEYFERFDFFLE